MTPSGPPFSPNYVHIADVARAHVVALRTGQLDPPRRKRVLLVAGYMLWHEVIAHLAEAMPEIKERLPSALCGPGPQAMPYARFETKNAREILGIEDHKDWREAIEDAVKDLLKVDSKILMPQA
jgi:nucleoside-diphosphate-sugar epimerase